MGLGTEKNTKSVYQYKIEKKFDYEVLLKSNDLYTTNILPADLYYASKSIDAFSINFEYELKGNKKIDTEVDYNINTEKIDDFIELDIPITDTITEVNKNYENENVVDIMPPIEKIKIKKYIYYTIAGLCIIIDCFICIKKSKKIK